MSGAVTGRRMRQMSGRHDTSVTGEAELYQTPIGAVQALLATVSWFAERKRIADPCCGPGRITVALALDGHVVVPADLYDYSDRWFTPGDWVGIVEPPMWGVDFLDSEPMPGVDGIVMNPPYQQAGAFVAHALEICGRVFALLPLEFLQATGPLRRYLLDEGRWTHFLPFADRLDMHRDGFPDHKKVTQTRRHAWFGFTHTRHAQAHLPMTQRVWSEGGP